MITLPLDSDDSAILSALYGWVDLIASERYGDAYDLLCHPDGDVHTPDILRERIDFFAEQLNETVTSPLLAGEPSSRHLIARPDLNLPELKSTSSSRRVGTITELVTDAHRQNPSYLGDVELSLPFGGRWSDLYAFFKMIKVEDRLAFFLSDIRFS